METFYCFFPPRYNYLISFYFYFYFANIGIFPARLVRRHPSGAFPAPSQSVSQCSANYFLPPAPSHISHIPASPPPPTPPAPPPAPAEIRQTTTRSLNWRLDHRSNLPSSRHQKTQCQPYFFLCCHKMMGTFEYFKNMMEEFYF